MGRQVVNVALVIGLVSGCGGSTPPRRGATTATPATSSDNEPDPERVAFDKCKAIPVTPGIKPSPTATAPANGEPTIDDTFNWLRGKLDVTVTIHVAGDPNDSDDTGITTTMIQGVTELGDCKVKTAELSKVEAAGRVTTADCSVWNAALQDVDPKEITVQKYSQWLDAPSKDYDQDAWVVHDSKQLALKLPDEDLARRVGDAIKHAALLCGAKPGAF